MLSCSRRFLLGDAGDLDRQLLPVIGAATQRRIPCAGTRYVGRLRADIAPVAVPGEPGYVFVRVVQSRHTTAMWYFGAYYSSFLAERSSNLTVRP